MVGAGPREFVVAAGERGHRLDQFVQRSLAASGEVASRAEVQRWIGLGAVTVNRVRVKSSTDLRVGDVVLVSPAPDARTAAVPDADVAFDVVYEDDTIVVVNKPAGLVVHPARSHPSGTLVNGLLARGYFDLADASTLSDARDPEGHRRPGIVHRIDKGTSGLLVVARNAVAREGLKRQLSAHTVLREYDALALGDVKVLDHDTLHGRHPKDRLRFTTHLREGKRAVTHVASVERFGVATYVRCRLNTGRTHQIRVHLAESGTPILGDTLYGAQPRTGPLARLAKDLGHQALHARLLGFTHPVTGEELRFEAPLPADFALALVTLRSLGGT